MKLIKEIFENDINPGAPAVDESRFRTRTAARAIVTDDDGKVALLYVGRHNYHKLPGGGVEGDEDIRQALERELLEEIGCRVEVNGEVGKVIEHLDQFEQIQTSYCFTAKLIGEKGEPDFTEDELLDQFSIVWVKDIHEAIKLLESDAPTYYQGKSINIRDLALLKAAV